MAIREINNWRAARSSSPLSPRGFKNASERALFPVAKEALSRLSELVAKASEEDGVS